MQSRYKKLVSNSLLFMIAQFGSKVLMTIVVPLYTYLLTTSEYGAIELSSSTLNIAAPCCMLLVYDAVLRFSMDAKVHKNEILTSALKVFLVGSLLSLVVVPVAYNIDSLRPYILYVYLLIIAYGLFYIFSQFAKGIDVKIFVVSGILYTAIFLACNVIFIVKLRRGVSGYILSQVLGYILSSLYCFVRLNAWKYISFKINTRNTTKQMLSYSIHLIPNALVWWVITSANRYFIEGFLGSDANGIYGIAAKIPNVIIIVGTIFIQAWQLSAIDEKENNTDINNRKVFFTNVFNCYSCALMICSAGLILICKPLLMLILSTDFQTAWRYVPILLLSSIYMMYAQFWSSLFIAEKSSKELSSSSIISGIISLALNVILIPRFGLMAASIVCFISCFVMWILRVYFARKYDMIKVNLKREMATLIVLLIECNIIILDLKMVGWCISIVLFGSLLFVYKNELKTIFNMGLKLLMRR